MVSTICPVCGKDVPDIQADMCLQCGCTHPCSIAAQKLGANAPRLICYNPFCGTPDDPTVLYPQAVPKQQGLKPVLLQRRIECAASLPCLRHNKSNTPKTTEHQLGKVGSVGGSVYLGA